MGEGIVSGTITPDKYVISRKDLKLTSENYFGQKNCNNKRGQKEKKQLHFLKKNQNQEF